MQLYIILIRPERNVRQSMMPNRHNTTKSSALTDASNLMAPVTLTAVTCDQNRAFKKHIISTADNSTQSESKLLLQKYLFSKTIFLYKYYEKIIRYKTVN